MSLKTKLNNRTQELSPYILPHSLKEKSLVSLLLHTYISGPSVCLTDLVAANVQLLSLFPQSAVHGLHQLRRASPGIQLIVKVLCGFHQTVQ